MIVSVTDNELTLSDATGHTGSKADCPYAYDGSCGNGTHISQECATTQNIADTAVVDLTTIFNPLTSMDDVVDLVEDNEVVFNCYCDGEGNMVLMIILDIIAK